MRKNVENEKEGKAEKDDWDDGRVIAPMGECAPTFGGVPDKTRELRKNVKVKTSKKERRAMTKGMFAVMLPRLLVILLGFGLTYLLLFLWFR